MFPLPHASADQRHATSDASNLRWQQVEARAPELWGFLHAGDVDESRIFLRTVRPPSDASGAQRTDAGNGVPGHLFEPAVCNGRYVSQVLADGFVRVLAHILTQETGYSQEMGFLCVNATRLARHTTDHETRRSVLTVMLNADDDRYCCVPASTVAAMMETGSTKTKKIKKATKRG